MNEANLICEFERMEAQALACVEDGLAAASERLMREAAVLREELLANMQREFAVLREELLANTQRRAAPVATSLPPVSGDIPTGTPEDVQQAVHASSSLPDTCRNWNSNVICEGKTAQDRVQWLIDEGERKGEPLGEQAARLQVMAEFPSLFPKPLVVLEDMSGTTWAPSVDVAAVITHSTTPQAKEAANDNLMAHRGRVDTTLIVKKATKHAVQGTVWIGQTINLCLSKLMWLFLVYCCLVFSFSTFLSTAYGIFFVQFSSFFRTVYTLVMFSLGMPDDAFEGVQMWESNAHFWVAMYLCSYMISMITIFMQFFVTIILDVYTSLTAAIVHCLK